MLQKLKHCSQAAKIAGLFCVSLVLLTVMAWIMFQLDPARVAWADYMTLRRGCLLALLLAATSTAVYFAARLWLDEVPASTDELETAWRAGLSALAQVGISLREHPVFLFLGASSTEQQRRLVIASNQKLLVDAPAKVNAPLNWFATDEAIYLFCGSVGVLGRTQQNLHLQRGRHNVGPSAAVGVDDIQASHFDHELWNATGSEPQNETSGGTRVEADERSQFAIEPVQQAGDTATMVRPTAEVAKTSGQSAQQAERRLDELQMLVDDQQQLDSSTRIDSLRLATASLSPLTSTEIADGQQALTEVCMRLRGQRRPVAAINGVGIVLDACLATSSEAAARHCGEAIRVDVQQLRSVLGQYAPISIILAGMDYHPGITEAIRRLGAVRSSDVMLGHICDPREVCDRHSIERTVEQALASLNSFIHYLIRSPDALTMPSNPRLLRLMIDGRQRFLGPLKSLLSQALSTGAGDAESQPTYCNGVFFASTGDRPVEQAFASPIFKRLQSQQHWLSWTAAELRNQRREQMIAWSLAAVTIGEIVWLGIQLFR